MITDDQYQLAFDRATSEGWLTQEEGRALVDACAATSGDIVEVGCYQGRSAMIFAQLFRDRLLHCVDPWDDAFHSDLKGEEIFEKFVTHLAEVGATCGLHCHLWRMPVENWTPVPAGFVYLDGDHTYTGTIAQIRKALDCHPQALAIHDIANSGDGAHIKRAALEQLGGWDRLVGRLGVWFLPGAFSNRY